MIRLDELPTTPPAGLKEEEVEKQTKDLIDEIGDQTEILFAQEKYAILILFQGMDASGKDGAVRKVFEEVHPNVINTFSFKKPTEEEMKHDFLWRVHQRVPPKGKLHIFNRSHYEDILIQRVHNWIDNEQAERRMESINQFEELLVYDNNTVIIKFFLHLSYQQQEKELRERLEDPDKFWKHKDGDWEEREHWTDYQRCYEYAINASRIPWHIVPVDERWYRDFLVAETVARALRNLDLEYPQLRTEKKW